MLVRFPRRLRAGLGGQHHQKRQDVGHEGRLAAGRDRGDRWHNRHRAATGRGPVCLQLLAAVRAEASTEHMAQLN